MTMDISLAGHFPLLFVPMSRALGKKPSWINTFIRALLHAVDANVIAVDWVYGSTGVYFSAVENVVKLSLEISRFLSKLLVGAKELRVTLGYLQRRNGAQREKNHPLRRLRAEAEPFRACWSLDQIWS